MSCGCGWATGVHMTEFSANGTGMYEAGSLGVTRSGGSAEGTYVLRALEVDMFSGLALKASYHSWVVGLESGMVMGLLLVPRLHNHLLLHTLPTMVFFFLFLFMLLFATFLLTVYIVLCKPGCAVSTADMSSV